jgi:hypothetical protein
VVRDIKKAVVRKKYKKMTSQGCTHSPPEYPRRPGMPSAGTALGTWSAAGTALGTQLVVTSMARGLLGSRALTRRSSPNETC